MIKVKHFHPDVVVIAFKAGLNQDQWGKIGVKLLIRAYPGSEFVVANALAKWKKVGANNY